MFTNKNLFSNACKLVLCTVLLSTFTYCADGKKVDKKQLKDVFAFSNVEVVEIDSCEYIYVPNGNGSWGAHKGNCKFCAQRNSK